jgi:hypothetical protein
MTTISVDGTALDRIVSDLRKHAAAESGTGWAGR